MQPQAWPAAAGHGIAGAPGIRSWRYQKKRRSPAPHDPEVSAMNPAPTLRPYNKCFGASLWQIHHTLNGYPMSKQAVGSSWMDTVTEDVVYTAGRHAGNVHAAGSQAGSSEQRTGGSTSAGLAAAERGRAADAERGVQFWHCWGHAHGSDKPGLMGSSAFKLHMGLRNCSCYSSKSCTLVPAFRWQLAVAPLDCSWCHYRRSIAETAFLIQAPSRTEQERCHNGHCGTGNLTCMLDVLATL